MRFAARDRVMVLAPHPDDETLGTGGLLQRVRAAGASARIIFATDGDDNPWPQRALERRIRIRTADRIRWAARRRQEAYAALAALGVPASWAVFLGLPDQGLTAIVTTQPSAAVQQLAATFRDWRPTLLVVPSLHDLHPDHNSLGFLTLQALTVMALADRPVVLAYIVHPLDTPAFPEGVHLHLTVDEQARKRAAIERYATQLVFHGRSYRRAASRVERFAVMSAAFGVGAALPMVSATVRAGVLDVRMPSWRPRAWLASLLIVGWRSAAEHAALRVEVHPWQRTARVYDSASRVVGTARCVTTRAACRITLPAPACSASTRLFVKAVSRLGFFDRGGWCEAAGPSLHRVDGEASRPGCDAGADGRPSSETAQHPARFQPSVSSSS